MKLNFDVLSTWYDQPLDTIKEINGKKKNLDLVEDISSCSKLRKLILSENSLTNENTSFIGLDKLTVLNLAHNQFSSLDGLENLTHLGVLNVSSNTIKKLPEDMSHFSNLKALILNNNKLSSAPNLSGLTSLNTLVISDNSLQKLSLANLTQLAKLSASHNKLKEIPDFSGQTESLKEARLNDNNIKTIPDTLRKCQALEIIDLGNNKIENWSDIASLGSLLKLNNLNLRGNPITDKKDYKDKILSLVPSLRVLDGERFDMKFLERKQRQSTNFKLMEKKDRLKREKLEKQLEEAAIEASLPPSSSSRKPRHKHILREEKGEQQPVATKATKTKTKTKAVTENAMDVDKEERKPTKPKTSSAMDVDKEERKKTAVKKTKAQQDPFFDAKAAKSANLSDATSAQSATSNEPTGSLTPKAATTTEATGTSNTNLTKRKADAQMTRTEQTGVLSRVDNSKKMKKKIDSENVLATLEKSKDQEESISTGLGADAWD